MRKYRRDKSPIEVPSGFTLQEATHLDLLDLKYRLSASDGWSIPALGKREPTPITVELIRYLVNLSDRADLTHWSCLSLIASIGSGMPYGILNDPKDVQTLLDLSGLGQGASVGRARKIDNFLQAQARKAAADIKRRLAVRPGRPRDEAKERKWTEGARLRELRYSWRKITRKLDPEGYATDHKGATDRMRLGIKWVSRMKSSSEKT